MNVLLYALTALFLVNTGVVDAPEVEVNPSAGSFVRIGDSLQIGRAPLDRSELDTDLADVSPLVPRSQPQRVDVPAKAITTNPNPITISLPPIDVTLIGRIDQAVSRLFSLDDDGVISAQGVFETTNDERVQRGLSPYEVDAELTAMAEVKLDDMIASDYFAHVSPSGDTIEDLANDSGYTYLLIGENLAYGAFRDADHIVSAWMDSPGHRANILHDSYTQIGIAVKRAQFQGASNWVAVQEFGLPQSACPVPDISIQIAIESRNNLLAKQQSGLVATRGRLEAATPDSANYYQDVEDYNDAVSTYNGLLEEQKEAVAKYNEMVRSYNQCLEAVTL